MQKLLMKEKIHLMNYLQEIRVLSRAEHFHLPVFAIGSHQTRLRLQVEVLLSAKQELAFHRLLGTRHCSVQIALADCSSLAHETARF